MAAFFPLSAYEQVKGIADPKADYANRLVHEFDLDIAAAHSLTGSAARLIDVVVPSSYAHWVPSGSCYNRLGYYELPNARLIYRKGGHVESFGIASMISWKGNWYVVHLGAVERSSGGGVVDDPSPGSGQPAPSSTC